jgi:hypothetical protein
MALEDFAGRTGHSWRLALWYQNVGDIYQSRWEGIVTLEP